MVSQVFAEVEGRAFFLPGLLRITVAAAAAAEAMDAESELLS